MQLDPAIVIFAALAVFVLWKLRSVLGERTGLEQPPQIGAAPNPAPAQPGQIEDELRWKDFAERGSARLVGSRRRVARSARFCAARFPRRGERGL